MLTSLVAAVLLQAGSGGTALVHEGAKWSLMVDGKPFTIKGAGGNGDWALLKANGGNAVRTWGAETIEADLDRAQKAGVKVMVGIWLGHKEQGFKYDDPAQVTKQFEAAKAVIQKYKDHPALLMWGIGNEMEGYDAGDDPKVWTAVEDIAHMAHEVDPHHPTATVVAEIGGKKVPAIEKMCPSVDILGINSYAGAASIYERYVKQGGTKPYVLTECGPPGAWESPSTAWKRPIELSSTAKEAYYERAYTANVVGHADLCLGCFSFLWSHKQEATATWFGMFLPDGTRLGAVDAMEKLWSGKAAASPCPRISALSVDGDPAVDPGQTVQAHLSATSPNGAALRVNWSLTKDSGVIGVNGESEDVPDTVPGSVTTSSENGATVKMPTTPGFYRLFAIVRDGHGGAACANVPLRVRGAVATELGAKVKLPFTIYSGSRDGLPYVPSGWMGSTGSMKIDLSNGDFSHSGGKALRWDYTAADGWGSIAWQSPEGDWGDKAGGYDLSGATKLTVWARGAAGGEAVSFGLGLIKAPKAYFDTAIVAGGKQVLSTTWQKFEISLAGKDLTRIKTGFVMTIAGQGKPLTIYLDDVRIE